MPKGRPLNEALDADGSPREAYAPLFSVLARMGPNLFAERRARARARLRALGATFPLPDGEDDEGERVLPADWVPRILPPAEWEHLRAGLLQRGKAINAWLTDLYHGEQEVVPREVIGSSVFYRSYAFPEGVTPVHVYGPDVVHLPSGEYAVLEDNVRVPSGAAYAEAMRIVGRASYPETFEPYDVSAVTPYYEKLRETLLRAAPPGVEEPTLAIVTGGEGDSAYFEHSRIAEACGLKLLTLLELRIENDRVLAPDGTVIDAIYRRVEGGYVVADLPDLERVYREGGVGFANALGVGVADDKAVFPYVPEMIRTYLGEEPILQGIATIPLADPERREEALERLEELVLKPRDGYGGTGVVIGPEADARTVDRARREVLENPEGFVAQECLDLSRHVLDDGDGGEPGEAYVDLRAFVLPAVDYVMPGGLTRVARPGTRIVNSSSGGSLKDTWVLEGRRTLCAASAAS